MLSAPPPLLIAAFCALAVSGGAVLLTTPTTGDLNSYFSPESFQRGAACPGQPGDGEPAVDDFRAEWYAKVWRAADEPSLYLQSREARTAARRTYRFTWLRTFHAPVTVRLDERDGGRFWMTAKRLSGAGGYDPGQVADTVERMLTVDEARAVLERLDSSKIMSADPVLCHYGADGAQWIFESVENGKLRYADRWAPKSDPVRDVGLIFLSLTGWKLEPLY